MSFDLHLGIPDDSPEGRNLRTIVDRDQITPEEAVRRLLRDASAKSNPALSGLGLFSDPEDAAILDAAVSLAYEERRRPSRRLVDL